MGRYNVKILSKAQEDFSEIIDYLNTLSSEAALRDYDLLTEKITSLSEMPERCALARDVQLRLRGYRVLVVGQYFVFFVIPGDTIHIRRILYGRRQYEPLI